MADSTSWQLALMRSRLSNLERKAEQPNADSARLLGQCVREMKNTFEFLEIAGDRLRAADAELKKTQGSVRHGQDRFKSLVDLLSDKRTKVRPSRGIRLPAYGIVWLAAATEQHGAFA